jgi:predicted sugar kinase
MALLPALAESDLDEFGRALIRIQQITGNWFAPVQGGAFAAGPTTELVRRMQAWQVPAFGQSSWGPTVYAIVDGADAAAQLADRLRDSLQAMGGGEVVFGAFPNEGARVRVTRGAATPGSP